LSLLVILAINLGLQYQAEATPKRHEVVATAYKYLGNRYRYGSIPRTYHSPSDCSGLVVAVYGESGIALPRTSRQQARIGVEVNTPAPGDLIFFRGRRGGISHVGIYIGGSQYIHASSAAGGVIISRLERRIAKAVRVINR
jgi:cell wall-associated NlpC family hydrolase